jgi:hypothetical protein
MAEDWMDELGASQARLSSIERGLDGDFLGSAEQYAIANALQQRDQPAYRPRPQPWGNSGYLRFRAVLVVFCILVLAALIVFR